MFNSYYKIEFFTVIIMKTYNKFILYLKINYIDKKY
jgi:hypothetical protein